jgi:hypothetical protein
MGYFVENRITFSYSSSRLSDYYFIRNIKGKENHTLKIRISNHPPFHSYEIPFLGFDYGKKNCVPGKGKIAQILAQYIDKYKEQ